MEAELVFPIPGGRPCRSKRLGVLGKHWDMCDRQRSTAAEVTGCRWGEQGRKWP